MSPCVFSCCKSAKLVVISFWKKREPLIIAKTQSIFFHSFQRDLDLDNQDSESLEVTLVRASNLQMFRNINNNKTCSNPARYVLRIKKHVNLLILFNQDRWYANLDRQPCLSKIAIHISSNHKYLPITWN